MRKGGVSLESNNFNKREISTTIVCAAVQVHDIGELSLITNSFNKREISITIVSAAVQAA